MENKISLSGVCQRYRQKRSSISGKNVLARTYVWLRGGGGGSGGGCFFHFPDIESQNRTPCYAATLLRDSSRF